MKRRTLLKLSLAAVSAGTAGVGLTAYRYVKSVYPPSDLVKETKRALSYLNLQCTDEELFRFVDDYESRFGPVQRDRYDLISMVTGRLSPNLQNYIGYFLQSTDFFENGADESKPVVFVAIYDPYEDVCQNPLVANP